MSNAYNPQNQGDLWTHIKVNQLREALDVVDNVGFFPVQGASYIVFKEGSLYYARNGKTGEIDYSNSNITTLVSTVESIVDDSGGTIILKEIRKPDVDISSNVRIIEFYQGNIREYTYSGIKFRTLGTRTNPQTLVYYDSDGYYVCRAHAEVTTGTYSSLWSLDELFGFGVYEATAKVSGVTINTDLFVFGFEAHHGWAGEGIICFWIDGGVYKTQTAIGGVSTNTELTGQDWSSDTVFKIEWSASTVKFYVNGVLKSTHTTNIPQIPMMWFIELGAISAPGAEFGVWQKNFKQIS